MARMNVHVCVCKVLADQRIVKKYWGVEWVSALFVSKKVTFQFRASAAISSVF